MKRLTGIMGVLLILMALVMIGFLALLGAESSLTAGELLARGWLLILMGVVAAAFGVYLLIAWRRPSAPPDDERPSSERRPSD